MSTNTGTVGNLEGIDIGVIVGYFVVVMAFGLWSSCKNRGSVGGYFLAGRNMHFVLVGASLFASNIGSGHFIGLAGSGASSGYGVAVFELNAIFILQILGWIFVPVYIASGVFTMPEYLRKRFGGQRIRVYLAVLALLLSIFTKVAADLFAGAIFLTQAFDFNIYIAICILLAIAALFTIAGGLTAVIWTDFIQTIIMLIGACYLMIVSFIKIGGFEVIMHQYLKSIPNTTIAYRMLGREEHLWNCGIPPANSLHLFRAADDPNLPWPGVIFGLTISSVWYWCTDQVIVQRALAAKNYTHAKAGCVLAGFIKFTPMWLIIVPGMIARILYPDEIGCVDETTCKNVCGSAAGCTNIAFPLLVIRLMPVGARGLMIAVMMSALMSSLTSVFNSSSTIFTVDIWKRFRSHATDVEIMIVSRVFVLAMVAISIAWIPIVQNFSQLFDYIQSVTSYLAPPICAVYVLAVMWKRTNEQGAFWGLMIGLAIGVTRFAWESAYSKVACGYEADSKTPKVISSVHYLHFGMLLFGIVFFAVIAISILTKPIDDKHLVRLLFWNRHSHEKRVDLDEDEQMEKTIDDTGHANNGFVQADGDLEGLQYKQSDSTVSAIVQTPDTSPWYRVAISWICGIEKHPEISPEQQAAMTKAQTSLDEVPKYKALCNALSLLLMGFAVFYWGFFA